MNLVALRNEFSNKSVSFADARKRLGISRSALYRKMRGMVQFNLKEIEGLAELLSLSDLELIEIFFK